ncbi:SET domain-containing protein [Diplogelasinospora grovesii]|uniref:SET domain-containing protein n=1 Tax=Diplogelasinospora grovesii TaxID=303347 RepID=A0AAN6N5J0_9PEZI|nr:SET domain-containing protein [Diplogelasinospora grovesii]
MSTALEIQLEPQAVSTPLYVIRDVPGKGKGMIATQKIPRGTRILSEEPIITVRENGSHEDKRKSLGQQVDALTEQDRQSFLSMHNIHPYKTSAEQYVGIIRTVALPVDLPDGGDAAGIFKDACRINHACDNNTQRDWNTLIQRLTIHALRDIEEGEEITIYYLGVHQNRATRQAALRNKFGFTCSCRLCSLPPEQQRESDKRLDEIYRLDNLIGQGGMISILTSPLRILRLVDQQVRLYNEDRPEDDTGLPRSYLGAAQIAIANGDLARGRVFIERAVSGYRIFGGDDSRGVIENEPLAKDPTKHQFYSRSPGKWQTAVNDVPLGLSPSDFEDWLWRREKKPPAAAAAPGQRIPAHLRSRETFPSFDELPSENDLDLEYYVHDPETEAYVPQRHWCFLGEIVDIENFLRLRMVLKDVDGNRLVLAFYTDGRGRELEPGEVKKGNTVAVLHAEQHGFLDMTTGIRHENPDMIKIFPASLDTLLALSDEVQQFSTVLGGGVRTCHGCGKTAPGASLKRCAKCSYFWYCDRTCQVKGWNEKNHKASCKLLKDPDLQGVFEFKWDEFSEHVRFPLQYPLQSTNMPPPSSEQLEALMRMMRAGGRNPFGDLGL